MNQRRLALSEQFPSLEGLTGDLRMVVRRLFTHGRSLILAIAALGIGMGAITAVLALAAVLVVRPYPFPDAARLVTLDAVDASGGVGAHYRDFVDWRARNNAFEEMAIFVPESCVLAEQGESQPLRGYATTAGALRVLAVSPILGRFFNQQEDMPDGSRVAVLGESLWRVRFGARNDILGRAVILDGTPHTIIGVMSDRVTLPRMPRPDVWRPLRGNPAGPRGGQQFYVILARLKDGMSLAHSRVEMDRISRAMAREDSTLEGTRVVVSEAASRDRGRMLLPITLVFFVTLCLLLLVSANVACLQCAHGVSRAREVGVRMALGATRSRIAREVLFESVLLALVGAIAGLAFADWLIEIAMHVAPSLDLDATVRLDGGVLGLTFLFAVVTALLFGAAPSYQFSRTDASSALHGGMRQSRGGPQARLTSRLVLIEIALSTTLLVVGGLLSHDLVSLMSRRTGIGAERALAFRVELPSHQYGTPTRRELFVVDVLERLRATSDAAAAITKLPLSGYRTSVRVRRGPYVDRRRQAFSANINEVTPGYFRTLGIPLLRGRDFDERDAPGSPDVAMVNEDLALRYFPGEDPVGQVISTEGGPSLTIRGVVGSVRQEASSQEPMPEIFRPLAQTGVPSGVFFVLSSTSKSAQLSGLARQALHAAAPGVPALEVRTLEQVIYDALARPRFLARVFVGFAVLAALLTFTGLYSVVAYTVASRRREIAIRMAVGASSARVVRELMEDGLRLVGVGIGSGLLLALGAAQGIRTMLVATTPHDPLVLGAAVLVVLTASAVAVYVPARKASRSDPLTSLTAE